MTGEVHTPAPADGDITPKVDTRLVHGLAGAATVAEAIVIADTRDARHAENCPVKAEVAELRRWVRVLALAVLFLAALVVILWRTKGRWRYFE